MTETAKTKPQRTPDEVQRTPDEPYGVIEMRFLCAEKIVKRGTGEIIEVTDKMRLLYIYMLNQFLGFSARKQSFYKDQREMAAALGWSRGKTGEALAGLKRIGLVGTAGRQGNSEVYTVCFLSDISETLDIVHKDWKGEPAWNHARASKNFKSKKQKPEESKNDGKSKSKEPNHTVVDAATVGNDEQHGLQQSVDHRVDAVSPHDAVKSFPWDGDAFLGNGKLAPGSREWAQSQGAKTWEEEIRLVWKLSGLDIEPNETQRPDDVPESQPVKQQKPDPKPEPVIEFDNAIPF